MKKLIIAALAASGAAVAYAQAETGDREGRNSEFRAEMRALIDGDGLKVDDLANLLQARAEQRFAAMDTDSDGIVTREEFLAVAADRAESRFERMNPDENGVVTRSGREGWGRHHRDGPRAERHGPGKEQRAERRGERISEQFTRLDTDGDGMISREEFEAGMNARAERSAERRDDRAQRRSERHERRAQMPEEMREMRGQLRALMREGMTLESFSNLTQEQAGARFDRLDADGHGEITLEEFTSNLAERAQKMFARMDRDDDGVVTRDDRPRWGGGPRHR